MPTADHDPTQTGQDESSIRDFLIGRVAEHCRITPQQVDPDRPLAELGLGSRDTMAITGELEELLDRSLPATLVYEHPTIAALARALTRPAHGPHVPIPHPRRNPSAEPIAVIGLGCRFPGGIDGPEAYWRFLLDRGDAIGEVPEGRWDLSGGEFEAPEPATRLGGFLDDIAGFDSRFFAITPGEADAMDPQQRLLVEVAWEAFEHAGIAPAALRGTRTGVFVGVCAPEYASLTATDSSDLSVWTATGAALSIVANRVSYLLDLRGPSLSVDTACSSSLVATHLAVRSLLAGESDIAVAGGVNVLLSPMITMTFDLAGGTAPDGRCKAFDASANGMVRAEGCGVVILKRLGDAQRDGDRVLAIIENTSVNSDGRSNGLVAPSQEAQEALLREAYAGLEPPDYVEAHGTGTLLGDPIEARALGAVLGQGRTEPLLIGSAKTNLGHLEPAAGAAGLIKTILSLRNRAIPASLHYRQPNPHIDFDGLGVKVVTEQTPWPSGPGRAGVSSFGFGGTNAHVVLAAAPPEPAPSPEPTARGSAAVHTLLLSDVSADRVFEYAGRLADNLLNGELEDPSDVAHTLARRYGRGRFGAAVVGRDRDALIAGLRALHSQHLLSRPRHTGPVHPGVITGTTTGASAPVWVFSGYGAQRPGMARRLLAEEPAFADAIEQLESLIHVEAGFSVREALESGRMGPPAETMVVLFAVQIGLARLWRSCGVMPAAVIGHSMGEVAAAVVAGGLSVGDGVTVISRRAHLLTSVVNRGAMAVLGVSAEEAAELTVGCPDVDVAARLAPRQMVITGDADQIATVVERSAARGLLARLVRAAGAGHSPQVEPLMEPLRERLAGISSTAPKVPFYSTVSDDPRRVPIFDGHYWAANLRNPVRLLDAVKAAAEDGHRTFVEISAHPLLTSALAETVEDALVLPTLRRSSVKGEEPDDTVTFHTQLAALKLGGLPVGVPASARIVDVPRPSWRHRHHWMKRTVQATRSPNHPLLGVHIEVPGESHGESRGEHRHMWSTHVGMDPLPWLPVHDVAVLPAAAYAEIALAAGAEALGTDALTVVGLRIERLLPLDEHTTITTTCTLITHWRRARGCRVHVQTRTPAGIWISLATATCASTTRAQSTVDRHPGRYITVPRAEGGSRHFRLHPIVLDRCLAAFGMEWTAMAIGSLRVLGPTQAGGRCEISSSRQDDGTEVASLRLVDDRGNVLLEVDDVVLHRLPRAAVPVALSAKLFEAGWHESVADMAPSASPVGAEQAGWLLLSDPCDSHDNSRDEFCEAEVIARGLVAAGRRVIGCQRLNRDRLTPLHESPGPVNVVVLVPPRLVDEELALTITGLARDLPAGRRLWIATQRAAAVLDGEAGEPGQAFLHALTRVLNFEHPALCPVLVDVDSPAALVAELLGAGTSPQTGTEVAWRDCRRYEMRLRAARLGAGPPLDVVRRGGAYVISGGYGGLGLVTARWLAERGAGRVVLSGRYGPRPEAEKIIDALRATGMEVEIVLGDIALPHVAERMVAAARANGVRLCGVVHAAGGLDDRLAAHIRPEDLHRVWSPKVDGALRLHEATEHLDLDWWVVYSSAAALLGSPGQAAYAAANARVDALVDWRRTHGLPGTTINWGTWAEVGGATRLPATILDPITPQEGADALEALLAHDRAATGVFRFNRSRVLASFPEVRERPYFSELLRPDGHARADHDRADHDGPDHDGWPELSSLLAADPDNAQRLVSTRVRRRVSAVLGFTPDPERPLTEVGLDSLVAIRVKSALEHDLGLNVSVSALLQGASVATLEAELCRQLDPQVGRQTGLQTGPQPDPDPLPELPPGQSGWPAGGDAGRRIVRPLTDRARRHLLSPGTPGTRPFFCAHAAGGTSAVYEQLAALLGQDLAFFGLERFEDAPCVEERAARYIQAIRATQPEGPYRLGGWSFGGVLAYEIARQLGTAEVELVAMIDGGLPKRVENPAEAAAHRYVNFGKYLTRTYDMPVNLTFEELVTLAEEQQLGLVIDRTRAVMERLPWAAAVHQFTSHEDTRSLERYAPGPYEGRVVLYRSTEPTPWTVHDSRYDLDGANGFGDLCPNLEIIPVPGTHHLNLLDPPGVHVIADDLRDRLLSTVAGTPPEQVPNRPSTTPDRAR